MKPTIIKVLIIESDPEQQKIYRDYFANTDAYELCGIFKNVHETLLNLPRLMPEIIVSEAYFKGISGLDGIELIKKRQEHVKILIMSHQSHFEVIRKAFRKGADGYLTKPISAHRFFNALESIAQHGTIIEHDVARQIISSFQRKTYAQFSKRENQIIEFLKQGSTYKVIAKKLFVTTSTVNFHIQNIYLKLNVNSKSEALDKLRLLEMKEVEFN